MSLECLAMSRETKSEQQNRKRQTEILGNSNATHSICNKENFKIDKAILCCNCYNSIHKKI